MKNVWFFEEEKDGKDGDGDEVTNHADLTGVSLDLFGNEQKGGPDQVADNDEQVAENGESEAKAVAKRRFKSEDEGAQKSDKNPRLFVGADFFV